jgi:hypothetical protein
LHLSITSTQVAEREVADFQGRLEPNIKRTEADAKDLQETVIDALRGRRPEERTQDAVRGAVSALQQLQAEQTRLLDAIQQTGKYTTERVERARHAAENLVRIRAEISHQYEQCLRRGDDWNVEKDENLLQHLLNQALEAEIAYRRAASQV